MRNRKIVKSKNMMEISDHITGNSYVTEKGKKVRQKKEKVTPEAVRRNNLRIARSKLRMLIDNNFVSGDWYLTLTFKNQTSLQEAKEVIKKFNRKLRDLYRKENHELKYIYIVEGKKRIHFHILISQGIDITPELMKALWPYGYTKIEMYRGEAEDAIALAKYFLKEKEQAITNEKSGIKQRWVASLNLDKPEEYKKVLKATEWKKGIYVPEGYYLDKDSVYEGINNAGYPFRFYRLIKLSSKLTDWRIFKE